MGNSYRRSVHIKSHHYRARMNLKEARHARWSAAKRLRSPLSILSDNLCNAPGSNSGKRFPIGRRIFPEQGVDKQCNDRICFFRKKFRFLSRGILFSPGTDSQAAITVDKSLSLSQGFTIKSAAPFFQGRDSQFDITKKQ